MANTPEEMLQNILGNPAAMEQIMGMIGAFQGNTAEKSAEEPKTPKPSPLPFGLDNPETLMRLGNAFSKISNDDDPRINLLTAIKPYLSKRRLQGAEQAMQILKLSKMTSLFEELKIF